MALRIPFVKNDAQRAMLALLSVLAVGGLAAPGKMALAAERQEVAIAVSLPARADEATSDLAGALLSLLELRASQYDHIAIVERMQIDLALNELILDRSLNANQKTQLQLNRLVTADLIVTAQFLDPVPREQNPKEPKANEPKSTPPSAGGDARAGQPMERRLQRVVVRVVEALTGSIRGVTVASVDETNVDDVADQVARYLSALIESPAEAGVTVAVGAFDSVGRFDRLRPLELGIRDMITTGLLKYGGFQVLQRSDMEELNRELALIRSGFADQSLLPKSLPSREAAYLFQGTIDEQDREGQREVVVEGRLIHSGSGAIVQDLRFQTNPERLPTELAHMVRLVGAHLTKSSDGKTRPARRHRFDETQHLYRLALSDVLRFRRISPIDFSYRTLEVFDKKLAPPARDRLPMVLDPESVLGRHLLRKSIDRLESVLYIQPERTGVRYALAFCYSFDIDTISNPKRAAELLGSTYDRDPRGAEGAAALRLLAEVSFDSSSGRLPDSRRETAIGQIAFAFSHMPARHRTIRWPRLLTLLANCKPRGEQCQPLLDTMNGAVELYGRSETNQEQRAGLAKGVAQLAAVVLVQGSPELRSAARTRLAQWAADDSPDLALAASRTLGNIALQKMEHAEAADWFLAAAEICQGHPRRESESVRQNLLMHAGRSLRMADEPAKALRILEAIERSEGSNELNRGYVEVEIGACYESLKKPRQALDIYVAAAESVPHLVDNSDVVRRIERLGGVPVREDRPFDVRYVSGPDDKPYLCRVLVADQHRLYSGGAASGKFSKGILVRDLAGGDWRHIGAEVGVVTCLVIQHGHLWAGTADNGIWRYSLESQRWDHWSDRQGVPDQRVLSLATRGEKVYAGVGTRAAGGLIEIDTDSDDVVRVLDGPNSPRTAPTHLVAQPRRLLACCGDQVHQLKFDSGEWQQQRVASSLSLHTGGHQVWASSYGRELYPFEWSDAPDDESVYRRAWFPAGQGKSGYLVRFVIERDDEIWFGGTPWQRFQSTGFYRLDVPSGSFSQFGPRDGFRPSTTYEVFDGVWAADRFWLATSAGLAELTCRQGTAASVEKEPK